MTSRAFCVFILSHGRPESVRTLDRLTQGNYSGDWRIIVDNEDATREEYLRRFGPERVIVFDKQAIAQTFDQADLAQDRRAVVYARNACFQIARDLGLTHFLELDDDYSWLGYKYEDGDLLRGVHATNLDRLFAAMLDWLDASGAATVALGQGGDLIGGQRSRRWEKKVLRKAMNSFFLRTDAAWRFLGRVNEDVNSYVLLSHRGLLFLTTLRASVVQTSTQQKSGGMTELYRSSGTYAKSFYPVLMCPSAVTVRLMPGKLESSRIHHQIDWNACAPKILAESCRKPRPEGARS